eukprot:10136389-Alexandrium_andersonii.AAC.1
MHCPLGMLGGGAVPSVAAEGGTLRWSCRCTQRPFGSALSVGALASYTELWPSLRGDEWLVGVRVLL